MVLDGLGFNYFKAKNKSLVLKEGLRGGITSVFPSTTASAITTFVTGTAPQQHAWTGWFMNLKELGMVSTVLRFNPRLGGETFTQYGVKVRDILDGPFFTEKIKVSSYLVMEEKIKNSDFTKATSKKAKKVLGYKTLEGFLRQIKKAIKFNKQRKYIYAYWPELDWLMHSYGTKGKQVEKHFDELTKSLEKFIEEIKGTNTALIITADHGLIDTTERKVVWLEKHPKLKECLTLPLCGEPRVVYCYVRPSKTRQFEDYVKTRLNKACWLYKSEDLMRRNYFGLFKPNPKLGERIGDYILIMKDNYIFKDCLLGKKASFNRGNHGGISEEEMKVPLIFFDL